MSLETNTFNFFGRRTWKYIQILDFKYIYIIFYQDSLSHFNFQFNWLSNFWTCHGLGFQKQSNEFTTNYVNCHRVLRWINYFLNFCIWKYWVYQVRWHIFICFLHIYINCYKFFFNFNRNPTFKISFTNKKIDQINNLG